MRMLAAIILFIISALPHRAAGAERVRLDLSREAVERGEEVFHSSCALCHGLKYYRDAEHREGIKAGMEAEAMKASLGAEAPDLSLMAISRGKGTEGAEYIYRLLTSYSVGEDGRMMNAAFADETQTEGAIAMPPPIALDDPELLRKANDVAAFLLEAAEPAKERSSVGAKVIIYMAVLTALLYIINRLTWMDVKKRSPWK